ncbi:MAG: lysylphosphatidylglycerol synthase transmembrane domain-containing protein [Gemmatimonadetes bacterium]|nr:lysylphosphatidylglycerol synthase transmembrane domain-containing protein [Gemmatimonadota bacterium]
MRPASVAGPGQTGRGGRELNLLKKAWGWLRWLVALGILGYLIYLYREQYADFIRREIDFTFLGIGIVLATTATVLAFFRWYLLARGQKLVLGFREAVRLGFVSNLFNYLAPGTAGGDIVRAVGIARRQKSRRTVAAATVLLDRLIGMLALLIVGSAAALLNQDLWHHREIMIAVLVFWGGALTGLICVVVSLRFRLLNWTFFQRLTRLKFVGSFFAELAGSLELYQTRRSALTEALLIGLAGQFFMLSAFYCCAMALLPGAAAPDYWAHLMLIPAAEIIGTFAPVPGGVGALEGAVIYIYHLVSTTADGSVPGTVAQATGLAAALTYRIVRVTVAAVGALYYMVTDRKWKERLGLEEA